MRGATDTRTPGPDPRDPAWEEEDDQLVATAPPGCHVGTNCAQGGPRGIITTIAGTGAEGYSGDRGQAIQATFRDPVTMAVDADGSVYIADHHNSVVRRVAPDGTISTVAGSGNVASGKIGGASARPGAWCWVTSAAALSTV